MPLPAGTGLTRTRVRRPAPRGSRSRSTAAPGSPRGSWRTGSPGAATLPPQPRARLGLPRGRDRRALGALPGRRPALLPAAPEPRAAPPRRDSRSPRTRRLRWHPSRRAARDAPRRGQGDGDAGGRLRQPRPVALHLPPLLGGRRHRPETPHRLARPLPRRDRHHGQPAAGALARRRPPARARDREGAGRDARRPPTSTASRPPACPRSRSRTGCSQAAAHSAASTRVGRDQALAPGRLGGAAVAGPPRPARASSAPTSTLRSPTRSRPTRSRTGSPGSRR